MIAEDFVQVNKDFGIVGSINPAGLRLLCENYKSCLFLCADSEPVE